MITVLAGLLSLKLAFLSAFVGFIIILQKIRIHHFGLELKRQVKLGNKINLEKSVDNFLESDIIDFNFKEMVILNVH